jgi:predicted RNA-binding protein YlxR (DUF448 family)
LSIGIPKGGRIETRSCLGCRAKEPRKQLLRFTENGGRLVLDFEKEGKKGRGGYVHFHSSCLSKVLSQRVWKRALRTEVELDLGDLRKLTSLHAGSSEASEIDLAALQQVVLHAERVAPRESQESPSNGDGKKVKPAGKFFPGGRK